MPRLLKLIIRLAVLGLVLTIVIVAYLEFTNSTTSPPLSNPLAAVFVILCPPSLLSIPFIDAEPGTGGFYFLWSVIALINAALYGGIGATVGLLRYLWKSNDHAAPPRN